MKLSCPNIRTTDDLLTLVTNFDRRFGVNQVTCDELRKAVRNQNYLYDSRCNVYCIVTPDLYEESLIYNYLNYITSVINSKYPIADDSISKTVKFLIHSGWILAFAAPSDQGLVNRIKDVEELLQRLHIQSQRQYAFSMVNNGINERYADLWVNKLEVAPLFRKVGSLLGENNRYLELANKPYLIRSMDFYLVLNFIAKNKEQEALIYEMG